MYKHPTPHENGDDLSFPMMYHTVVYTIYSAPDGHFNIISNLVTMVRHNFLPKWFPWQPISCNMSTVFGQNMKYGED